MATVARHGQHHAPASLSARQARVGFADERHLWPSAHWLVGQRRPVVVFGEQSGSADANDWIDLVQADVEAGLCLRGGCVSVCERRRAAPARVLIGWPTPIASNGRGAGNFNRQGVNLQTAALLAGWPTPTTTDNNQGGYRCGGQCNKEGNRLGAANWRLADANHATIVHMPQSMRTYRDKEKIQSARHARRYAARSG
jgi:hypothetical protein